MNPATQNRTEAIARLARAHRWSQLARRRAPTDRRPEIAAARWELATARQAQRAAVIWGWRLP